MLYVCYVCNNGKDTETVDEEHRTRKHVDNANTSSDGLLQMHAGPLGDGMIAVCEYFSNTIQSISH